MDETTQYASLRPVETPHKPLSGMIPFTRASRGLFTHSFDEESAFLTWAAPIPTPLNDFGGYKSRTTYPNLAIPVHKLSQASASFKAAEEPLSLPTSSFAPSEKNAGVADFAQEEKMQKVRLKKPEDRKLMKAGSFQERKQAKAAGKPRTQSSKRVLEQVKSLTALPKREPISPPTKLPLKAFPLSPSSHGAAVYTEKTMTPRANTSRKLEELRRPAIQLRASGLKTALRRASEQPQEEDGFMSISAYTPKSTTSASDWREVDEDTDILPRKAIPIRSQKPDRVPKRF